MQVRPWKIAVILLWASMMVWMVVRESTTDQTSVNVGGQEMLRDLGAEEGQEWFGIYLTTPGKENLKIGYSVSETRDRKDTRVIVSKSWMRLKVQGSEKTLRTETKILTDRDYTLINLDFMFSSDTIKFEVLGAVKGTTMNLRIKTAAGETKQTLTLTEPPVMPETIMARVVAAGIEVGKTFEMPFFDPTTFGFSTAQVRVTESKSVENDKTYWKLVASYKGIETQSWIDNNGKVQWQQAANFLTIRETKREAFNKGWSRGGVSEDILDRTKIRASKPIDNPRNSSKAILMLQGVDLADMTIGQGRQTFVPETNEVTITREQLDPTISYTLPADPEKYAKTLEATPMLQVNDPMIMQQTRDIIGNQKDALLAAKAIHNWVYRTLDKKPIVSIPSARDVLEIKRGDCNEHAALFTALARAAGIPTKIAVGIVYQQGAFYYHAWNTVWVGQWVEIDSTYGQFPADAVHVRMLEGDLDQQIALIQFFGKLSVDVVSVE